MKPTTVLWVHLIMTLPLLIVLCALLLRSLKGWLVCSQYFYKAEEGRLAVTNMERAYRPITGIARESVHERQDGRHYGWHIRHRRSRSRKARPIGRSGRSCGERQIAWRGDLSAASNA